MKKEIRCGSCNRKLGEGVYTLISIKCPRCGALNNYKAESPTQQATSQTGSPGATSQKGTFHA